MLWMWLWACGGGGDPTSTGVPTDPTTATSAPTGDSASGDPTAPVAPTGGCGMAPYAWLPGDAVGDAVTVEPADDLSMSVATIEAVLALAGVPPDLVPLVHDVRSWRVRYTTQDRGELVEATMIVSLPEGAGAVPTLAWLHGTTGFTDACAPSALGLEGGAFNLLFSSLGYATVSPDYLGMNGFGERAAAVHPYTVAEPTALASLDALRAFWRWQGEVAGDVGSEGTTDTVLLGASEGGFAAFQVDRYQPYYLPEAQLLGAVASVPPADISGLMHHGLTTFGDTTGALVAATATWHDWYGLELPLDQVLQPDVAAAVPPALVADCDPTDALGTIETVDDLFTEAFIAAVASDDPTGFEEIFCVAEANSVATSPVPRRTDTPFFYTVAELDTLVAAGPTRDAFAPLCEQGYRMEYLECAGADHVDGAVWALFDQLAWLDARVLGLPLDDACVQHPAEDCDPEGLFDF